MWRGVLGKNQATCPPPTSAEVSIKSAKQDMRQGDSYMAGKVSPSRAYGHPLVVVVPGSEGPTNQVQCNRIQGSRYNTVSSAIVSRRYGLPSSPPDTKSECGVTLLSSGFLKVKVTTYRCGYFHANLPLLLTASPNEMSCRQLTARCGAGSNCSSTTSISLPT
jgi:hypothetical protein